MWLKTLSERLYNVDPGSAAYQRLVSEQARPATEEEIAEYLGQAPKSKRRRRPARTKKAE